MAGSIVGSNSLTKSQSEEATDVDTTVVEDWNKWLQSICEGYERKDIFNTDETGLYYRA